MSKTARPKIIKNKPVKVTNDKPTKIFKDPNLSPIFSSNDDCQLTNWIPPVIRHNSFIPSCSWFDTKMYYRNDPIDVPFVNVSIPIIPPDSLKQQNISIGKKKARIKKIQESKLETDEPPVKTKKTRIKKIQEDDLETDELPVKAKKTPIKKIQEDDLETDALFVKIKNPDKLTPAFITTEKIKIYPTHHQLLILDSWLDGCTDMFNIAIKFIENKIYERDDEFDHVLDKHDHKILIPNISKTLTIENIRPFLLARRNIIVNSMKTPIKIHIIDEAIRQAIACFKSSITSTEKVLEWQKKYIEENPNRPEPVTPTFRIRPLKHSRPRRVLKLESDFFKTPGTFCPTVFDKFKSSKEITNFDSTVTLLHDRASKKYMLLVPIRNKIKDNCKIIHDAVGIDLGVRTFITAYSQNYTLSICNSARQWKLQNCIKKIDRIKRLISLKRNAATLRSLMSKKKSLIDLISKTESKTKRAELKHKGLKIVEEIESKKKDREKSLEILVIKEEINERRRFDKNITPLYKRIKDAKKGVLEKALLKYEVKKQNLAKDMHYKAANILVKGCDRIYIGNLSTKKIVSRSNITIRKSTKKTILALAPYKFKQILMHMGYKYGCVVKEVSEYLTTKTCSNCGNMYEIGSSKVYKCKKCKMESDRDENSAKTHLKLGLEKEILAEANSRPRKRQVIRQDQKRGNSLRTSNVSQKKK